MINRNVNVVLALLLAVAAPCAMAQVVQFETEPNNSTAAANAITLTNNVAKVKGNVYPNADEDFFSFTVAAAGKAYVSTQTLYSSNSSFDSIIEVIGTNGTTVLETDNDDGTFGATSSVIAGVSLPAAGTYFIRVRHTSATTQLRGYDLYVSVQTGAPTAEVEANDTPATANAVPASGYISGLCNPVANQDYFSINLNQGDTLFAMLDCDPERDSVTFNGRLGLGIFGGNQLLVVNDANVTSPNGEAFFMTVAATTTYYVFVDDGGTSGSVTATYGLSVGVIPAPTATLSTFTNNTPVAIPATGGQVTSVINIAQSLRIRKIGLAIDLTHALMADLDVSLIAPAGNEIHLFTDIGATTTGGQTVMLMGLSDDAAIPPSFTVVSGMIYQPEIVTKLDMLQGQNTLGNWTLVVRDDTNNASGGTLNSWSLIVEDEPAKATPATGFTYSTIFSTDFESGAAGFTHSASVGTDNWALGTPNTVAAGMAPFTSARSGSNCFKTNLTGAYSTSSSMELVSPNINLAGVVAPIYVDWGMAHQVENANFDHMFVEVREVGGASAIFRAWEWLGSTPTQSMGTPATTVQFSHGWGLHSARIDAFAGKVIQVVFHLDSDNTVEFSGMLIDDVSVVGAVGNPEIDVYDAPTGGTLLSTPAAITGVNCGPSGTALVYRAENVGTANLTFPGTALTLAGSTGPVTVTFSQPTSPVAPAGNSQFTITVTATGNGAFTATVNLANNDSNENPYVFNISGNASVNAPPTLALAGGTSFAAGSDFGLTLNPAVALANADLTFDDSTPDDVDVTITFTGGPMGATPPTGITAPTGGTTVAASLPGTLSWTGTADAANTPGTYTWQVSLDDGTTVVNYDVDITITDVAPTHVAAAGQPGTADGSVANPYEATYTEGLGTAVTVDLATVSDANTGQSLSITNVNQTSGPSTGSGFTFTLNSGTTLRIAPTATLNASDVGVQVFDVTVSDGTNPVVITVEATVNAAIVFTSSATLTGATQNVVYAGFNVTSTGGTGAVTYAVTTGALPTGLVLAANGAVSGGTTDAPATFNFTITATDSLGATTTQAADITVTAPAGGIPSITTTSPLTTGTINVVYAGVAFAATGGTPAYTWALAPASAALPAGMTLDAAGNLAGTPTASGTFNITVRVTDSASVFADGAFTLVIDAAPTGGGGGGGGDDGGGCAVDATGNTWIGLVAILGVLGLATRLRRAGR